jgi:oxygen-independent coproporphyrinogen-3 oxidase
LPLHRKEANYMTNAAQKLYPTIADYERHFDPDWFQPFPAVDREYIWTYPVALRAMTGAALCEPPVDLPTSDRLSIYVHVPYCQTVCPFCAFMHVVASVDLGRYAACVARETEWYAQHPAVSGAFVSDVYFGGGTASLLHPDHISRILAAIRGGFQTHPDVEVTVECHPDTIDVAYMDALLALGVTRLSMGVQSFQQRFLQAIGRKQDAAKSAIMLSEALHNRFRTVSIDLMYRLPGQTEADWMT